METLELAVARPVECLIALALAATGCRGMPEPATPLTPPAAICSRELTRACREPQAIEDMLRDPALEIVGTADTPHGIQGARVFTLALGQGPRRTVFRAKWRAFATWTALNDPRRELAAYAVQRLFLDPADYVVPPSATHCFPVDEYRARVVSRAQGSWRQIPCVLGFLSYWLEGARSVAQAQDDGLLEDDERAFDSTLFERSRSYRDSAANTNLLTYLIHHGDSHADQFLFLGAPALHLYSVDNSLSFGAFKNPDLVEDWSNLIVPALPSRSLARLLAVSEADVRALSVIERLERTPSGLVPNLERPPVGGGGAGLRWRDRSLEVGLSDREIELVWSKLHALKELARQGRLRTYSDQ